MLIDYSDVVWKQQKGKKSGANNFDFLSFHYVWYKVNLRIYFILWHLLCQNVQTRDLNIDEYFSM